MDVGYIMIMGYLVAMYYIQEYLSMGLIPTSFWSSSSGSFRPWDDVISRYGNLQMMHRYVFASIP